MPERRGGLQDRRYRSHAATSAMVGKVGGIIVVIVIVWARADRTGQAGLS